MSDLRVETHCNRSIATRATSARWTISVFACLAWFGSISVHAGSATVFDDGFETPCSGASQDAPGCIRMPFGLPPDPSSLIVPTRAAWTKVDLYLLLDRSVSMAGEVSSLLASGNAAIDANECSAAQAGDPFNCIASLWTGAGTFAYSDSGAAAYANAADLRDVTDLSSVPTGAPPGSSTLEATRLALYSTMTGDGGAVCSVASVVPRQDCSGAPAGEEGVGYPCFRPDATPLVVLVSDEPSNVNFTCPDWDAVVRPAFLARQARLMSILGSGASTATRDEFEGFALGTRAVDLSNGGTPLVLDGPNANAAAALSLALQLFENGAPLDVEAILVDDPADTVDTAVFVDHVETAQEGTVECTNGLDEVDSGGHPSADRFLDLRAGTPICFRLVLNENLTVPSTSTPVSYPAHLLVLGDGRMPIKSIPLYFVVPP
jgi:hypothetical protein